MQIKHQEVELTTKEIEAIKLSDVEGLKFKVCAKIMKISVAEFNDLIYEARTKAAMALINGLPIKIIDSNFSDEKITTICKFRCSICGEIYIINYLENEISCPLCYSNKIMTNEEAGFCK